MREKALLREIRVVFLLMEVISPKREDMTSVVGGNDEISHLFSCDLFPLVDVSLSSEFSALRVQQCKTSTGSYRRKYSRPFLHSEQFLMVFFSVFSHTGSVDPPW